jgi:hypothetical protein
MRIETKEYDDVTYLGGLFIGCCVLHWDMLGIAHGEESIDRAVLVAAHRVDNRMTFENDTEKELVVSTIIRNVWQSRVYCLRLTGWPHRNQERSRAVQRSLDLQIRRLEVVM